MNEYNIKLDTELNHRCVDGTPASEEEILLQIWQGLKRLNSKHTEENTMGKRTFRSQTTTRKKNE